MPSLSLYAPEKDGHGQAELHTKFKPVMVFAMLTR